MSAPLRDNRAVRSWPSLEADIALRVSSAAEIQHILRKIMDRAAVVAAYYRNGKEFSLSTIIGVSAETNELFLEPGPDELANKRMLESNKLLFVTHEGQVKIKFIAERISEVEMMGVRAYRIAIPEFLVRLQRREFFRIPTSIVNPVLCSFRLGHGQETTAVLSDISVGGVALLDNRQTLDFKQGNRYEHCYIDLPGQGMFEMGLEVRNVAETRKVKNGVITRRAGCKFLNLSRNAENIVQRYIMSLEMSQDMRSGRRILLKR